MSALRAFRSAGVRACSTGAEPPAGSAVPGRTARLARNLFSRFVVGGVRPGGEAPGPASPGRRRFLGALAAAPIAAPALARAALAAAPIRGAWQHRLMLGTLGGDVQASGVVFAPTLAARDDLVLAIRDAGVFPSPKDMTVLRASLRPPTPAQQFASTVLDGGGDPCVAPAFSIIDDEGSGP